MTNLNVTRTGYESNMQRKNDNFPGLTTFPIRPQNRPIIIFKPQEQETPNKDNNNIVNVLFPSTDYMKDIAKILKNNPMSLYNLLGCLTGQKDYSELTANCREGLNDAIKDCPAGVLFNMIS